MTEKATHFAFDDGLPTKPDVDLLLATWPDLKVGDSIEYENVARLIGKPAQSNRFRAVCNNWRARLLEKGLVVECKAGAGFYVASADQITAGTYGTLRHVCRTARKQRRKLAVAKVETEAQRATIEHQARLMLAVERDGKKHRMNLLPSTATEQQVRIAPPKIA